MVGCMHPIFPKIVYVIVYTFKHKRELRYYQKHEDCYRDFKIRDLWQKLS